MNGPVPSRLPRLVAYVSRALAAGIVIFWVGAMVWLRDEGGVADGWLPTAFVLGALLPPPRLRTMPGERATFAWRSLLGVVLGAVLAALVYGAVATPSRHWDGAASFDAKVFWLSSSLCLQQPFFALPEVFHHSPDYPLLLPLLVAATERWLGGGLGRLWLPLVHGMVLMTIATSLWRASVPARVVSAVVLAVGLTPALLGPGGGAVDSGYSDALMLLATTLMAAGLLLRAPIELGLGVVLAIASKPEGVVYVGVAALVAFVCGQRRAVATSGGAALLGLLAWLPTQHLLLHLAAGATSTPTWVVAIGIPAAVGVMSGIDAMARRGARATLVRFWTAVLALLAVASALPWLASLLPPDSALGIYLHRGADWQRGLAVLPVYLTALAEYTVLRVNFGLWFVLTFLLLCWPVRRPPFEAPPQRALRWFLGLGLAATALPFLFTPEADVQFHLRASLPRLLLHWLGPAALLVGSRLATLLQPPPMPDAGEARPLGAS